MNIATASHDMYYLIIALVAGVGLYFSLKTEESEQTGYFKAQKTRTGISIAMASLLFMFFYSLIILLPGLPTQSFLIPLVSLMVGAVIIPGLITKNTFASITSLFEKFKGASRILISLHSLIFLCIVQILLLIHISDFVIQTYGGESNFSLLVLIIVVAGIYTIIGGLKAVVYTNSIASAMVFGGIGVILFDTLFPMGQTVFSFRNSYQFGEAIFRTHGMAESNIFFIAFGFAVMIFWLMWMELGEVHRKRAFRSKISVMNLMKYPAAGMSIILLALYWCTQHPPFSSYSEPLLSGGLFNDFVGLTFLVGLMGMFAVTYQSAGTIVALELFPYLQKEKNSEEQVLVGRLTTVVVVLITIFLIPVVKISGDMIVIWFIDFLAFFTTPVVAAFLIFLVWGKGKSGIFVGAAVAGEIYAMIQYLFPAGTIHAAMFQSSSSYAFSLDIFIVTTVFGYLIMKVYEVGVFQRISSHSI